MDGHSRGGPRRMGDRRGIVPAPEPLTGVVYLRERELRRRALHVEVRNAALIMFRAADDPAELGRARVRVGKAIAALDKFEAERVPLAIRARAHGGEET